MSQDDDQESIAKLLAELDGGPVSVTTLTTYVRVLALTAFHRQAELMELRGRVNSLQGTVGNLARQVRALHAASRPGEDVVIDTKPSEGGQS